MTLHQDPSFSNLTQSFQYHLQKVLEQLQKDPLSITADDARRLHEHYNAVDERSSRIISAVESFAVANHEIQSEKGEPHSVSDEASLQSIVIDLHATIDANPGSVTPEVLKLAQTAVSKMQKAIGHTHAPHPELEPLLQEEYAKIEPKVEKGIVTKEEADKLHSLEARAHGHTEKGGLTAHAQSIAAKREKRKSMSLSDTSNGQGLSHEEQSHKDMEANLENVALALRPKIGREPENLAKDETNMLHSRESRAHGHTEKGIITADKNENTTAVAAE
ncbi:uncharacterized protein BDR25DRAFT_374841 [Lindgomyces ingoldianus]|uniref:Uncharacterized protein n=1 Tax=Lindgomyces ingoldianus TaxID=673940 RepID=A0ACB6QKM2_9PLEO|nr:uncharacterized protein BDR25DRAFT_374841 [Lindgomyces ingoldianus]KAF2467514.1 hypothetical protein BDR25DRAFT_374841 [Lindgomyces ingoldianus]